MRIITLALAAAFVSFMLIDIQLNTASTNPTGAPAGVTGSPGDGLTCARSGCHTGGPAITDHQTQITSDVPVTGYIPGTTYTITATLTKTGISRFGFEMSPQSPTGTQLGTLIAGSGSHLIGGTKYVTHSSTGTSGTGTKTWSFQWTAPAAGSGDVTFYGSFMFANNNGNDSGDAVKTDQYTVAEDLSAGISDILNANISVFPSPATDRLSVVTGSKAQTVNVSLFDINGRLIIDRDLANASGSVKLDLEQYITPGLYVLRLTATDTQAITKVVVR